MSGTVTKKQSPDLQIASADAIGTKMSRSLNVVMKWQDTPLPPRFALGSGDLRGLAIRVREQPTSFMIALQQSLLTATNGESLCKRGQDASIVLLEGGDLQHSAQEKKEFTTITLQEIKQCASDLNDHTKSTKEKFRVLRTAIYKELTQVTDKRDRPDFFVRLSRFLSKPIVPVEKIAGLITLKGSDVRTCEEVLRQVCEDLADIENTLDLIIHWWQKVESDANYLLMNGESLLKLQENRIILNKIKDSFVTLEKYFGEYLEKMSLIFDENVILLNVNNKKCVMDVQNRPQLITAQVAA